MAEIVEQPVGLVSQPLEYEDVLASARRTCERHAIDADDLHTLLEVLGLEE